MVLHFFLIGCITYQENDEIQNGNQYDFYVNNYYDGGDKLYNITHFSTISSALEKSIDNTFIYVYNGIYYEEIFINENITLKGEDPFQTIIDGKNIYKNIVTVQGNCRLNISGFTIRNNSQNITLTGDLGAGINIRSNGNIIKNNIIKNNYNGIYCPYFDDNVIVGNHFFNNSEYGAFLTFGSDNNIISHNIFECNNYCAVRIKGSKSNYFKYNVIKNNPKGLYLCCGTQGTIIFGNVFCNQSDWDVYDYLDNQWNNETKGNFWDSFHLDSQGALDVDGNGIVDDPYLMPYSHNVDNHPLKHIPKIKNNFFDFTDLEC